MEIVSSCHSNTACTCLSWQAESTLNQLLTCMDGLATREPGRPVVVIAATNRPEAQLEPCLEGVNAASTERCPKLVCSISIFW